MLLNMHRTQYGLTWNIKKDYKALSFDWLCSKPSKCKVKCASSRYATLP